MTRGRRQMLDSLQALRQDAALLVTLADAAIFGRPSDATQALARLPQALRRAAITSARAVEALAQEGLT